MTMNPVDYGIAKGLLNKLARRYAETHDPNLLQRMADLGDLLTAWNISETDFWHPISQPAH